MVLTSKQLWFSMCWNLIILPLEVAKPKWLNINININKLKVAAFRNISSPYERMNTIVSSKVITAWCIKDTLMFLYRSIISSFMNCFKLGAIYRMVGKWQHTCTLMGSLIFSNATSIWSNKKESNYDFIPLHKSDEKNSRYLSLTNLLFNLSVRYIMCPWLLRSFFFHQKLFFTPITTKLL